MDSLWLRIEQQPGNTGALTLWDRAFETDANPLFKDSFSLAPLMAPNAAGVPAWKSLMERVRESPAMDIGRFNQVGDELRKVLAACSVWNEWLSRWKNNTRTYLEIVDPPGAEWKLADLPFEYLAEIKNTGTVDRYFAYASRPILRVHASAAIAAPPIPQARAVIITGESIDWNGDAFPGNDAVAAMRELHNCPLCCHIELLETPTLDHLEKVLNRIKPEVIHFSGHGQVNPNTDLPALKISATPTWWWDTDKIHSVLAGRGWSPRLVVLNACDTAQANDFAPVINAFAQNGAAAVIGTQAQILQSSAPAISTALYGSLVKKELIDAAMITVRKSLGNLNGGNGWHQRDWGLPVLTLAMPPEQLFARPASVAGRPDPEQVVESCRALRDFVQARTRTGFIALGWHKERWECLEYLSTKPCIVVKGVPGGGKSKLAIRALRDAALLGQQVRYVEVCGADSRANFIDLLGTIVDGDPRKLGYEIYKPLDSQHFAEFNAHRKLSRQAIDALSLDEIQAICGAFERGLQKASSGQELTIVLDQFGRDNPKSSFSADEFKIKLLPYLWTHVAQGKVEGIRVIFVVRDDQYLEYDLGSLGAAEIPLSQFQQGDHAKLFYELCRFRRKVMSGGKEFELEPFKTISSVMIGGDNHWPPSKLQKITDLIENLP